jgi:hypothetical protein
MGGEEAVGRRVGRWRRVWGRKEDGGGERGRRSPRTSGIPPRKATFRDASFDRHSSPMEGEFASSPPSWRRSGKRPASRRRADQARISCAAPESGRSELTPTSMRSGERSRGQSGGRRGDEKATRPCAGARTGLRADGRASKLRRGEGWRTDAVRIGTPERQTDGQEDVGKQAGRQADTQTDEEMGGQGGRQAGRQTER